ncbi:hypothetical protein C2S51_015944 [Perilla frutescens var. frutescens]|nr:hypothetical protein C2S51_015944 [Perilla frutescens var. frutescens]
MHQLMAISQDLAFYGGRWEWSVEDLELDLLDAEQACGNWQPDAYVQNNNCFRRIRSQLAVKNIDIHLLNFYRKGLQWEERFHNLNGRLTKGWSQYDTAENRVQDYSPTWTTIA